MNRTQEVTAMGYTLEQFAAKCRDALQSQSGTEGRKAVCALVKDVLKDGDFVAKYIPEGTPERQVLFEDPELGFTILAHGYVGAKNSKPHDHGPSWAIYGQAAGETIMTDWDCLARPTETTPGKAKHVRDYTMKPGDAYLYDTGVLHSPRREGSTRLLRIEGMNMERVKRFPYEATDTLSPAAE
jgi:hypothetical protein